jgi:hypothetical protein
MHMVTTRDARPATNTKSTPAPIVIRLRLTCTYIIVALFRFSEFRFSEFAPLRSPRSTTGLLDQRTHKA